MKMTPTATPQATAGPGINLPGTVDIPVTLQGLSGRPVAARVTTVGQGRPLVMLHGMLATNIHWTPLLDLIRHRWRCTMLELPLLELEGADCSIDGVTTLTHEFINRFAPEPQAYLGSSLGGHTALRIALERPSNVTALILAGAAGVVENPITGNVTLRPSKEWVRERVGAMFHDKEKHITEHELERVYADLSDRPKARAIVKLTRSSRKEYMGDRLPEIKVPTLVVWGKQDAITPPEAGREFGSRLPDAKLVWFDDCSHAPMVEHPNLFARTMNEFADELDRRERGG
jgi:2-hydroxy-6-oxonona-2,4-dienedioate hydrolase